MALSTAGLYQFLKDNSVDMRLDSLRFEFCSNADKLILDLDTAIKIELIDKPSKSLLVSKETVLSALDTCVTQIGKYALKIYLLEPTTRFNDIIRRQKIIKELLSNTNVFKEIKNCLENLKNMQTIVHLSYLMGSIPNEKFSNTVLRLLNMLNSTLKSLKDLSAIIATLSAEYMKSIHHQLNQPVIDVLYQKLHEVLRSPNINETEYRTEENKIFLIQDGVNEFLDSLKLSYSDNLAKVRFLVEKYSENCKENFQIAFSKSKGFHIKSKLKKHSAINSFGNEFQVIHRTNSFIYLTSSKLCEINKKLMTIHNEIQIVNNV